MKKTLLLVFTFCFSLLAFSQVQIGNDIDGESGLLNNRFGYSVSLSTDGNIMAVGAPYNDGYKNPSTTGTVRVYRNTNGVWTQIGQDIMGATSLGWSVSLSGDGSTVAVGAPENSDNKDQVRIYRNIDETWTQIGNNITGNTSGNDSFGYSVSISSDGNILAIGAPLNDSVGVYEFKNNEWTQVGADIKGGDGSGDRLGLSVSLSAYGNIVAVSDPYYRSGRVSSGRARIFKNINGNWIQVGNAIDGEPDENLGRNVCLSKDGSRVAVSVPNYSEGEYIGHIRIYENKNDEWTQIGSEINTEFPGDTSRTTGINLSLSSNGKVIAIGAQNNDGNGENSGHVRVFEEIDGNWTQVGDDINGASSEDIFGKGISLSGDGQVVAVGAPHNEENGYRSGEVRVFRNINNSWTQIGDDINDEQGISPDHFGYSIDLSSEGNTLVVGAPFKDGLNGYRTGQVMVYENNNGEWIQKDNEISGHNYEDGFGASVSISSNGQVVAIGTPYSDANGEDSGQVSVYQNRSGVWSQLGSSIDGEFPGDHSGISVDLSSDGTVLAIGAQFNDGNGEDSGHVRVYKNINDTWIQIGNDINGIAEGDQSGKSMCLSPDGNVLAIGAPLNDSNANSSGHVRIYKNINDTWTQIGNDIVGEKEWSRIGASVSLSYNGNIVAIYALTDDRLDGTIGYASIYKNVNGTWTKIGNDISGRFDRKFYESRTSISLSYNGNIVAVGMPRDTHYGPNYKFLSGSTKIYKNNNGIWTQIGNDIYGEYYYDYSGRSVSLSSDGNKVAIGTDFNHENGEYSGHVRVYDLTAVLSTESFKQDYFSFHPNPVNNVLNIELNNGLELKQVNIYNIQSQYLYSVKTKTINTENLKSGFYFVEVETNKGKSAQKIVVE